jgi:hypothetical protein
VTTVRRAWEIARGWPLRTAAVCLACAFVWSQLGAADQSQARDQMLAAGADMLRAPQTPGTGDDRLLMNGAELRVERGSTPRSIADVLAAAEASCPHGSTVRDGDEQRGFVACADAGAGATSLPVAYVYAERRADGTHFIDFHSPRPIDLRTLFPQAGDAPGSDPEALPRPPSSRRALTLRAADQPYGTAVYRDRERSLDELVAHYQRALPGAGWQAIASWRVGESPGPREASVVIERAGVMALLLVAQDRSETTTTFLTMEANREQ